MNPKDRITVLEAASILQMDPATVRFLIEKEKLPIGYYVRRSGKRRGMYIIYKDLLDKVMGKTNGNWV